MRPLAALALALLLAVPAPVLAAAGHPAQSLGSPSADHPPAATQRPDPPADRLGWEGGYWYDDPIDVDQSDGLDRRERRAYVNRTMARIEVLRDREFRDPVPVHVQSRASFRERSSNATASPSYRAWNDQVWEAMFVVGEDRDAQSVIEDTLGSSVAGYYDSSTGEIRIIVPDGDRAAIGRGTLAHELTHALQDQYGALEGSRPTQDGSLARDGLIEGEANYVERLYAQRCEAGWACVATPSNSGGGGGQPNQAVLFTVYQPYSDGPQYVDWLRQRGEWNAVDTAYDDLPVSTEQTIHLTDERPVPLPADDPARNGWERFPNQGVDGSDTLGEASTFMLFWYQSTTHSGADPIVNTDTFFHADGPYDAYNYSAPPSAGWANDRVFPYRHNTSSGTDYGYVWLTAWDSPDDARQFASAYRQVLAYHDAERVGTGVWVVRDGPFADAFAVRRNGTRVRVVNAPTVAALSDIRPDVAADANATNATGTGTRAGAGTGAGSGAGAGAGSGDGAGGTTGSAGTDGFGAVAALLALAALLLALAARVGFGGRGR